jgi:hypothetical protein
MKTSKLVAGAVSLVVLSLMACKKDDPPPATPIQPVTTPATAAPQPGQPGYQAPGYQPAAPPAPGQLATPGPTAMACQNDGQCMLHHCNMQFQKCAFPCVSDTDCIQGAHCLTPLGPLAFCSQ